MKPTKWKRDDVVGPFTLLQRTDSKVILYDDRLPVAQRTFEGRTFATFDEAAEYALAVLERKTTRGVGKVAGGKR